MSLSARSLVVGPLCAALLASMTAAVVAGPVAASPASPVTVSLQFDDGRDEVAAARILDHHHIPATFFVNTGYVGTGGGYFGWKDLHDLSARGHEIAGHTLTHRDLATLSVPEQQREICGDRQALVAHGFAATDFAYPFGSYTDATERIVRQCGYSSGRAAWGLWGSGCEDDPSTCPYAVDPARLDDRWAIPTAEAPIDLTTVYDLEQVVVNAEQHGGGWVQIFFHRICADDCDEYSWPPEQLDAFAAWLSARADQGTVTRTTQQVLSSAVHPVVAPPAAPAPPRGANMLRNPSLTAVDGDGVPRCWELTGGTSWSRPGGTHGRAEQVVNSGSPDGYAALAQPQDQGECAPSVYAGQRLTLSLAYRSSSHPRLAVWVHNDQGGWRFWRSGPVLAPSSRFRRTSWTIPAIPAHVSAVSVGVTLAGEGRVAVDDVDLRRVGPVAAYPFGSHRQSYVRGALRPSGARSSLDAATVSVYRAWKSAFVGNRCGHGWYEIYSPDADHPYVGEGQGYGMVVTASMAGADPQARRIFDGLVAYVLAHPSVHNRDLLAAEQNSRCVSDNGSDSATDGDMDVAYGLLLADKQWGSKGRYNYKALALRHIKAIKANEINPRTHLLTLGDWSHPGESHWWMTRTSDWMVDHLRAFRRATGDRAWDVILDAHQTLIRTLQSTYAPHTGLLPDFVVATDSRPRPAPGEVLESPDDGHYSWNACRDPWRIGVDALTSSDPRSAVAAGLLTTWARAATSGHPERIASTYRLNGSVVDPSHDVAFIAPFLVAAMSSRTAQPWLDALWRNVAATRVDPSVYYGASIQLQTMIVASGNYLRV